MRSSCLRIWRSRQKTVQLQTTFVSPARSTRPVPGYVRRASRCRATLTWKAGAMIPTHSRYVVIGAGVHGLSTSWHLARELRARGLGGGEDICVLDKRGAGAGASGIACGTVRNNYFQPAMRELMAHSVSVWESDPEAFSYHPVGFLQIAPEAMSADVAKIFS